MDAQLLVRMYNVGLGDCIYVCIPDTHREVHILIDCGNKFDDLERLGDCIEEMKIHLPDAGAGKKRLDLLVVTHPNEDHHKGFEKKFFGDIQIDRIWLSPAYNPEDPKAKGFRSLQAAALRALQGFAPFALGDLKLEVEDQILSLSKTEALKMLRTTLPADNGIQPLYVTASTPQDQLLNFEDETIQLKVLSPMADIDAFYLGGEGLLNPSHALNPQGLADGFQALFPDPQASPVKLPKNISAQDFQQLTGRMHANALAAADLAGEAANNLSVVLLLEWRGYRLLFTGDAEWNSADDGAVKAGRSNGSWNVMWQEHRDDLCQPLNFLKLGHHGSVNATPWTPLNPKTHVEHGINQILDHILPRPAEGEKPKARAVASTSRTTLWDSIPDPTLMAELGQRVANARTEYTENPNRRHVPPLIPQPQRTDLESQVTPTPEKPVPYIDVLFLETV
jgi:beta-lactamase superfamily II metal-dependent hydrolase